MGKLQIDVVVKSSEAEKALDSLAKKLEAASKAAESFGSVAAQSLQQFSSQISSSLSEINGKLGAIAGSFGRTGKMAITVDTSVAVKQLSDLDAQLGKTGAHLTEAGNKARTSLSSMEASFKSTLSNTVSRLANFGMIVGGLVTGGGLGALSVAAEKFAVGMANVNTLLDKSDPSVQQFAASVTSLSTATNKGAYDLSRGLYQALSSGIPATMGAGGAMDFLTQASKAASAGLATTEEAVLAGTRIFNTFGASAGTSTQVFDKLFQVVKDGVIEFPDLARGIGEVAGSAKAMGFSFDEMAAAIAVVSKVMPASETLTATRALMQSLGAPTQEVSRVARELGITLGEGAIQAKGLRGVLADIVEKSNGNKETMRKLIPEVNALTAAFAIGTSGGAGFATQHERIRTAIGTNAAAFEKQSVTITYQLENLRNRFVALAIAVANDMQPTIVEAIKNLAAAVSTINAKDVVATIVSIGSTIKSIVTTIVEFKALIADLAIGFVAFKSAQFVAGGLLAINSALTALTATTKTFSSVVAALPGFISLLVTAFLILKDVGKALGEGIAWLTTDLGRFNKEAIGAQKTAIAQAIALEADKKAVESLRRDLQEEAAKSGGISDEALELSRKRLQQQIKDNQIAAAQALKEARFARAAQNEEEAQNQEARARGFKDAARKILEIERNLEGERLRALRVVSNQIDAEEAASAESRAQTQIGARRKVGRELARETKEARERALSAAQAAEDLAKRQTQAAIEGYKERDDAGEISMSRQQQMYADALDMVNGYYEGQSDLVRQHELLAVERNDKLLGLERERLAGAQRYTQQALSDETKARDAVTAAIEKQAQRERELAKVRLAGAALKSKLAEIDLKEQQALDDFAQVIAKKEEERQKERLAQAEMRHKREQELIEAQVATMARQAQDVEARVRIRYETEGGRELDDARRQISELGAGATIAFAVGGLENAASYAYAQLKGAGVSLATSLIKSGDVLGGILVGAGIQLTELIGGGVAALVNAGIDKLGQYVGMIAEPTTEEVESAAAVQGLDKGPYGDIEKQFIRYEMMIENVINRLPELLNRVLPVMVTRLANAFTTGFPLIVDAFVKNMPTLMRAVVAALPPVFQAIIDQLPAIIDGIVALLPIMIETLLALIIGKGPELAVNIVTGFINAFIGHLPQLIQAIVEGIGKGLAELFSKINPASSAGSFLGNIPVIGEGIKYVGKAIEAVGDLWPFASGGIVPGPSGAAVPILAHAGELVIPPDITAGILGRGAADVQGMFAQMRSAFSASQAPSAPPSINVSPTPVTVVFEAKSRDSAALSRLISEMFVQQVRREGGTARNAREVSSMAVPNFPVARRNR